MKRSRFLARAAPCVDGDAAQRWLAANRDSEATHNCWAYRIGTTYRSSDDGEPGGTAGRPILAAIDGSGLDAIVVLVIRWYGGIKLGAGGLVRAYGGVAAECLRLAARIEHHPQVRLRLRCGFAQLGTVHRLLQNHAATLDGETHHADGATLQLRVRSDVQATLATALRDATRGQATLETPDDC